MSKPIGNTNNSMGSIEGLKSSINLYDVPSTTNPKNSKMALNVDTDELNFKQKLKRDLNILLLQSPKTTNESTWKSVNYTPTPKEQWPIDPQFGELNQIVKSASLGELLMHIRKGASYTNSGVRGAEFYNHGYPELKFLVKALNVIDRNGFPKEIEQLRKIQVSYDELSSNKEQQIADAYKWFKGALAKVVTNPKVAQLLLKETQGRNFGIYEVARAYDAVANKKSELASIKKKPPNRS